MLFRAREQEGFPALTFLQFAVTGIEAARGEGAMTRKDKRLMRQFETEYHGKAVDIEAHITYPKLGQSIHFGYLKEENKLIVGWCGGHKEIASTRKHH